jgi:SAM-dependent methyltransferase
MKRVHNVVQQSASWHSSYDAVASEYYDAKSHPTCANFSELSNKYIIPRLRTLVAEKGDILEIGPGKSSVAPVLEELNLDMRKLTLLDHSPGMLQYSKKWIERGAKNVIADAQSMRLPPDRFGVIVCSLGDPYNSTQFWQKVADLLVPSGVCLFTTPAYDWAMRFRIGTDIESAVFLLNSGESISVRSFIAPISEQIDMVVSNGLHLRDFTSYYLSDLSSIPSQKLLVDRTLRIPIVTGYTFQKRPD